MEDLDAAGAWWLGLALASALASVDCDKYNTKDKDNAYNNKNLSIIWYQKFKIPFYNMFWII